MSKIKLTNLAKSELAKNELQTVLGGREREVCCSCSCAYANNGGSSTSDNGYANAGDDKRSKTGDNAFKVYCDDYFFE